VKERKVKERKVKEKAPLPQTSPLSSSTSPLLPQRRNITTIKFNITFAAAAPLPQHYHHQVQYHLCRRITTIKFNIGNSSEEEGRGQANKQLRLKTNLSLLILEDKSKRRASGQLRSKTNLSLLISEVKSKRRTNEQLRSKTDLLPLILVNRPGIPA